jgi:hypothetical protein
MRIPSVGVASKIYLLLWAPALLLSAFISFIGGYVGTGFAPLWTAIPFLLVFPAVLCGIFSFRVSALTIAALFCWNIIVVTWPHLTLSGMMGSTIDVLFLVVTVSVILVALLSPFTSFVNFFRYVQTSDERRDG